MKNEELYGYAGKLLRVKLEEKEATEEKVQSEELRKFLGGNGYAAKMLYDELPKGIDPLSPKNKLIFATGPLTGTKVPGSGSIQVCFKSPLTNIWGESRCGGDWGPLLKKAGYDFLVIEDKSEEPVYLVINNKEIKFKSAVYLCEKTTSEKIEAIKEELNDKKYEVATIGLAGERLVRLANIMIGDRAAGRCGAGAVMGSKNLFAIAVKGTGEIPVKRPKEFKTAVKESIEIVKNHPGSPHYRTDGTTGDLPGCDEVGDFPTKNWRSNSWGKGQELYEHFKASNLVTNKGCYTGCMLSCGRVAKVESGKWKTPEHGGCEYESISAFTAFVLNEDMDAAVHATYLCNEYGLDTISTGSVIAFAMDCYEKGIITKEDAGGLDLNWGNTKTIVELTKKIAYKEGIGRILGEGTMRASREIGKGAEKLAMQGKGLEAPAHDPRSGKTLALTYGMGYRGMCHIHPLEGMAYDSYKVDFGLVPYGIPVPNEVDRFDEEGKGKIAKVIQDFGVVPDILGICKFYVYVGLGPSQLAKMVSSLTGWDIDGKELLKIGERCFNLLRMFNIREGISKRDDFLPERMLKLPEFGKYSSVENCEIKNYNKMLEECYEARGWNKETGIPYDDKLREVGLKG